MHIPSIGAAARKVVAMSAKVFNIESLAESLRYIFCNCRVLVESNSNQILTILQMNLCLNQLDSANQS